jgi:hypothetical protein
MKLGRNLRDGATCAKANKRHEKWQSQAKWQRRAKKSSKAKQKLKIHTPLEINSPLTLSMEALPLDRHLSCFFSQSPD